MTNDEEHAAIVDQLRRRGWDRLDAIEEADRLMAERIARREEEAAQEQYEEERRRFENEEMARHFEKHPHG